MVSRVNGSTAAADLSVSAGVSSSVSAKFEGELSHLALETREDEATESQKRESVDSNKPDALEQQQKEEGARSKELLWSSAEDPVLPVSPQNLDLASLKTKEAKQLGVQSNGEVWWFEKFSDTFQVETLGANIDVNILADLETAGQDELEFERNTLANNTPGSLDRRVLGNLKLAIQDSTL